MKEINLILSEIIYLYVCMYIFSPKEPIQKARRQPKQQENISQTYFWCEAYIQTDKEDVWWTDEHMNVPI